MTSHVGDMDYSAFAGDLKTIDAVERCLRRITEAVIKIGPERMSEIAPSLPASAVRGLGNLLRHDYDLVSLPAIYATVTDRLPGLRRDCERALSADD